ncbi:MAG: magnesium/cobalt transporter CorA [Pararhodobacter sp.]
MARPSRYARKRRNTPGSPPGRWVADPAASETRLHTIRYAPDSVIETDGLETGGGGTAWLNIDGLRDQAQLARIAETFGLHPLAMEDVVNLHQRPKAEDYRDHLFVVLRMPRPRAEGFSTEQVSLFLGRDHVLTFQEDPGDVFDPVRARLRNPQSPIRGRGADYLAYALIDAITDAYFPVLEAMGERIEELEDAVVSRADPDQIARIHAIKHDLRTIRSALWPLRDLMSALLRDDSGRFSEQTRLYLRDCHDHTFQLIDMVETYREIVSGLVDIHLSTQANQTNEVMRVLTLIATVFIPLTFVVGVYGMNFDVMPELHWRWGYPVVMALMGAIAVGLALWFRHKGWLGRSRR